jgi:hypothetical protein
MGTSIKRFVNILRTAALPEIVGHCSEFVATWSDTAARC